MNLKNHWEGLGRLTKDVTLNGEGNSLIARMTIAVTRDFKNTDGNYDSDFISVVAFGKQAEFAEKYFQKGKLIMVGGSIRTGSYTNKDGQKIYTTDVVAEKLDFVPGSKDESKSDNKSESKSKSEKKSDYNPDEDFMTLPEGEAEDLPW